MKNLAIVIIFVICSGGKEAEETINNLKNAYVYEANASRRYDLYARKADSEKRKEVARLFRAISKSESIHMKNHGNVLLELGETLPEVVIENVKVLKTEENLKMAIEPERSEYTDYYLKFLEEAEKENVPSAVSSFNQALRSDRQHLLLLRQVLLDYHHLPANDYYVNEKTGETMAVLQGTPAPKQILENPSFVKID